MAVTVVLSEIQRDTLQKVCDTFAPSLEEADDPHGFWARAASDIGVPDMIEQMLAAQGLNDAPQEVREQILHAVEDSSPEALAGVQSLKGMTLLLFYALPDPTTGRNPNWEAI